MKGYYKIFTYGCQMNVHESERFAAAFEQLGFEKTEIVEDCDTILLNTCCIRENAENKISGHIGELKRIKKVKPSLKIFIVGCMTQQKGYAEKLLAKFPFIDGIFGTFNTDCFAEVIKPYFDGENRPSKINVIDSELPIIEGQSYSRDSRIHSYVNISYGCNNFCTYCIVPYVKGRERSRKPDDIIREVESLLTNGYKEITLLGQNVDSYGNDFGNANGADFSTLIERTALLGGKFRLRFMSSHPKDMSFKVIDTIAKYPNICNCIHLPVQSGSNDVLKRMNRKYTRERYLEIIDRIREIIPNCGITSDVMVGFPGETEDDFLQTIDLVKYCRFSNAFTFVYSKRQGTPAASYTDQITEEVKTDRITRLVALQNALTVEESNDVYLGNSYEILIDDKDLKYSDRFSGRTESGRLVSVCGDESILGNFVNVKIVRAGASTLFGEIEK